MRSAKATAGIVWPKVPPKPGVDVTETMSRVDVFEVMRMAPKLEVWSKTEPRTSGNVVDCAGIEVEVPLGAVRAILVVAEELQREGGGRGAGVGDRDVGRVEGAVGAGGVSARGEERGDRARCRSRQLPHAAALESGVEGRSPVGSRARASTCRLGRPVLKAAQVPPESVDLKTPPPVPA